MAYESVASILGAEGERKTRRARRQYDRTAARRKRQARARRRKRHTRQRRELQELARETIPKLERRQARLSAPSLDVAGLIGEDPEIRRQRRLAEVEANLEAALARRAEVAGKVRRRRGRRAEPVTPTEVALALGSALPPVRAGVGIAAGARALFAAGGKKAATEAAEQTTKTGLARTAAAVRAARQAPTRAGQRIGARQAARKATKRGVKRRVLKQGPKGGKARPVGTGVVATGAAASAPIAAGPGSEPEVLNVARVGPELIRAAWDRPGATASASYRSLRDTLLGLPAAAYEVGAGTVEAVQGDTDRLKAVADQVIADVEHRYGPLARGDTDEFRQRVQTESGVTPFALDVLIVGPPISRGAGAAARAGRLGKRAERVATEPRPGLQVAPNVAREQQVSRGLAGAAAQRALDRRRRKAQETRAGRGGDPIAREAIEQGTVVPLRQGRQLTQDVAEGKGRGFIQLTEEQAREIIRNKRGDPAVRDELASLSRTERRGLTNALRLGIRDPETARAFLALRIREIKKNRPADMGGYNQVRGLQRLIDEADEVFTPKLAKVADSLRRREKRLAVGDPLKGERRRRDPALVSEQALLRRYAQQAEVLGITRREGQGAQVPDELLRAREEAAAPTVRDPRDVPTLEKEVRLLEEEKGKPGITIENAYAHGLRAEIPDSPMVVYRNEKGEPVGVLSVNYEFKFGPEKATGDLGRVIGVDKSKVSHASVVVHPAYRRQGIAQKMAQAAYEAGIPIHRVAENDFTEEGAALRQGVLARAEELARPIPGESTEAYIARVRAEAKRRGLADPGYVPSEPGRLRPTQRFAEFALGGRRASHQTKRYKGTLFRQGRESDNPEIVVRGLARNIKRRHNWSLVADTAERHVFQWSRNKSMSEARQYMDENNIDEGKIAWWNPGLFRKEAEAAVKGDSDETPNSADILDNPVIGEALTRSLRRDVDPKEFEKQKGWVAIPREVGDELEASIKASGGLPGRTLDILTTKSARYLLGANPPWLGFQVISNAALAGLAGAGPLTIAKSHLWWRGLPDEVQRDLAPYLGIGTFQADIRQPKVGAAVAAIKPERAQSLINTYRGMKASTFGRNLGKANPLDALFRVDNAQNNFFRRAVLYKQLNRDLYKRMNENVGKMAATQERITNIFKLDPDDQLRTLARDPMLLEKNAKHVSDYLGDYTRYTARERRYLKRNVMFYGYLRFSLRFAFYTMPMKHPVMTGLMGNLARLKTEEIKELIGSDMPWAIGQFYFDKGKMVVDLSRANPVLNAMTEASGLRQLFGIVPPYYQMLVSQITQQDVFTGKDWLVQGEPVPREFLDQGADRLRILTGDVLGLTFPYRLAEELVYKDQPQGADSLAFDPRPTKYAPGGEAAQSAAERRRAAERQGLLNRAIEEVTTIGPSEHIIDPARYIEQQRREEERALEGRERSSAGGWSSSGWGGGGW